MIRRDEFSDIPDRYGVFAFWPTDDESWLHPYDQTLASDYIPSDRVWQRFRGEQDYDLFCHGDIRFRAQARMWLPVEIESHWVGDWIEILSEHGQRRPMLAQITEVRWNRSQRKFEYSLQRYGRDLNRRFDSSCFRTVQALTWWQEETWRKGELRDAESIRIEPLEDNSK